MFGRATITLGIGPHSSWGLVLQTGCAAPTETIPPDAVAPVASGKSVSVLPGFIVTCSSTENVH